jgi:hypothetical protein
MQRDFLSYWLPDPAFAEIERRLPFNHAGAQQLNRRSVGDILWVVPVAEHELINFAG